MRARARRIVAAPPGGVLNVGSGIALPTGRLALWVLEGYGRGELVIESPREHDAFVLDVGRPEIAVRPALHLRRIAHELSRARSPSGQRDRTALVVEIRKIPKACVASETWPEFGS